MQGTHALEEAQVWGECKRGMVVVIRGLCCRDGSARSAGEPRGILSEAINLPARAKVMKCPSNAASLTCDCGSLIACLPGLLLLLRESSTKP